MKKLARYIRLSEWFDSKVPFMLMVLMFFYFINMNQCLPETFIICFLSYGLYVSMFLAFSYVINDYSDIEVDRKAEKQKIISELPQIIIIASMIVMIVIGIVPMLLIVQNKIGFLLLSIFIYVSGAAYSIHLFRFKEKGVWGLLECSIAQRCFPLIPLFFIIDVPISHFVVFQLISFVNGVRYLLVHQNIDYENDIKGGVKTIATAGKLNYRILIKISLLIETALVVVIFGQIISLTKIGIIVAVMYIIFEWIISVVVIKYIQADWIGSFICMPYEDLYNIFLPILCSILLAIENLILIVCAVLICMIVVKSFLGKLSFINIFIKARIKGSNKNLTRE
mgnify:CR=1 FL=1